MTATMTEGSRPVPAATTGSAARDADARALLASGDRKGVAVELSTSVPADTGPVVTTEIRRGNSPHRSGSGSVSIGDTFVIQVTSDHPSELRVYGDTGEPLARCSEDQGCTVERDGNVRRFRLELVLRASGNVRAVLFTGASIPEAFQSLDADVETAQRADIAVRQVANVHVQ
jgi:hypothetical protein